MLCTIFPCTREPIFRSWGGGVSLTTCFNQCQLQFQVCALCPYTSAVAGLECHLVSDFFPGVRYHTSVGTRGQSLDKEAEIVAAMQHLAAVKPL